MDTTEGSAFAATASDSVVSSGLMSIFCGVPEVPAVSTFESVIRNAPDMTRAITSTAPTTRPAKDARKMGSFLLLVLTTVRVSVYVDAWACAFWPATC
ncbi:Uncharacterised protein [Collinsella intestinalis]|nr:Uncharacterised protein [Collinsella intestinalis]